MRKIIAVFAIMLFGLCCIPGMAQAKKKDVITEDLNWIYSKKGDVYGFGHADGSSKNFKVKNLKTSNPKIATVRVKKTTEETYRPQKGKLKKKYYDWTVELSAKRPGTTKVSFDLVKGKKKTKYVYNLTIEKYTNPFSYFIIGKKNYTKKFNEEYGDSISIYTKKAVKNKKLNFKLKPGWKFSDAYIIKNKYGAYDDKNIKKISNGQKISIQRKNELFIELITPMGGSQFVFVDVDPAY